MFRCLSIWRAAALEPKADSGVGVGWGASAVVFGLGAGAWGGFANRFAKMRKDKRTVDMETMRDWVEPGSRVLDLGCGRGLLLEYIKRSIDIQAVGVDLELAKVQSCVKRGLSAYQGDMMEFMKVFPDKHFDYVICSRTMQELNEPAAVIREALRVSRHLLVGFVNFGYWQNRLNMLWRGSRIENEVYPGRWWESRPINPVSLHQFEAFCVEANICIQKRCLLRGDWRRAARIWPNWTCGYALYDLTQ